MSVLSKWKPRWLAIFWSTSTSSSSRFAPHALLGSAGVLRKSRYTFHASTTARVPLSVPRSEEHTSELQSQSNLVCRLLLEKKKKNREEAHRRSQERTTPSRGSTEERSS